MLKYWQLCLKHLYPGGISGLSGHIFMSQGCLQISCAALLFGTKPSKCCNILPNYLWLEKVFPWCYKSQTQESLRRLLHYYMILLRDESDSFSICWSPHFSTPPVLLNWRSKCLSFSSVTCTAAVISTAWKSVLLLGEERSNFPKTPWKFVSTCPRNLPYMIHPAFTACEWKKQ